MIVVLNCGAQISVSFFERLVTWVTQGFFLCCQISMREYLKAFYFFFCKVKYNDQKERHSDTHSEALTV